jgi:hypothetical protein
MGIFSSPKNRYAYVPPSGAADSPTLLTGADPNLMRVSGGGDPATPGNDVQVAQQRPAPTSSTPVSPPQISPAERQLMVQPGRGYGTVSQKKIEMGTETPEQRSANRNQALLEIARRPPPAGAIGATNCWGQWRTDADGLRRAPRDFRSVARECMCALKCTGSRASREGLPEMQQGRIWPGSSRAAKNLARRLPSTGRLLDENSP